MREQAYAWFNRRLMDITDPNVADEGEVHPESLETLATLDGPPPDARGPEAVFEETRARRAATPEVRQGLRRLFRLPDTLVEPQPRVLGTESRDGLRVVRLLLATEPDIRVPVVLLIPDGRTQPLPGIVLADSRGKSACLEAEWSHLRRLAGAGVCVAVADVRFFGEWGLDAQVQRMNGIFVGQPPAAVGTQDLLAISAWLRDRPEVIAERVGVVGLGEVGPLALMATAAEPLLAFAAAPDLGATYAAGRENPTAPHLVTVGDLPTIAAAAAPRPLWLSGAADPPAWRGLALQDGPGGMWEWLRELVPGNPT
jgi:dienelactone hydrolase